LEYFWPIQMDDILDEVEKLDFKDSGGGFGVKAMI
jgi:hypothetical protein